MLGRLIRELPRVDYVYEPKWDGFRCLAFRSGDEVELRSRNDRPLGRYFPEIVTAVRQRGPDSSVLNGKILVARAEAGGYDVPTRGSGVGDLTEIPCHAPSSRSVQRRGRHRAD